MHETGPEDNISIKRKQLGFRSWHRGTREVDLLLGRFADAHLAGFGTDDLAAYDRFLNNSDPDIYNWITGAEPVPPAEDNAVVRLLLAFYAGK
ncbi:MAG: succinate dehydrogenase assembly factor 2 [Alphaproteobacteria bacterium]|nr:succinate dehydrogenase assembly factor 2 [Alphaproteobacteria bacterium]